MKNTLQSIINYQTALLKRTSKPKIPDKIAFKGFFSELAPIQRLFGCSNKDIEVKTLRNLHNKREKSHSKEKKQEYYKGKCIKPLIDLYENSNEKQNEGEFNNYRINLRNFNKTSTHHSSSKEKNYKKHGKNQFLSPQFDKNEENNEVFKKNRVKTEYMDKNKWNDGNFQEIKIKKRGNSDNFKKSHVIQNSQSDLIRKIKKPMKFAIDSDVFMKFDANFEEMKNSAKIIKIRNKSSNLRANTNQDDLFANIKIEMKKFEKKRSLEKFNKILNNEQENKKALLEEFLIKPKKNEIKFNKNDEFGINDKNNIKIEEIKEIEDQLCKEEIQENHVKNANIHQKINPIIDDLKMVDKKIEINSIISENKIKNSEFIDKEVIKLEANTINFVNTNNINEKQSKNANIIEKTKKEDIIKEKQMKNTNIIEKMSKNLFKNNNDFRENFQRSNNEKKIENIIINENSIDLSEIKNVKNDVLMNEIEITVKSKNTESNIKNNTNIITNDTNPITNSNIEEIAVDSKNTYSNIVERTSTDNSKLKLNKEIIKEIYTENNNNNNQKAIKANLQKSIYETKQIINENSQKNKSNENTIKSLKNIKSPNNFKSPKNIINNNYNKQQKSKDLEDLNRYSTEKLQCNNNNDDIEDIKFEEVKQSNVCQVLSFLSQPQNLEISDKLIEKEHNKLNVVTQNIDMQKPADNIIIKQEKTIQKSKVITKPHENIKKIHTKTTNSKEELKTSSLHNVSDNLESILNEDFNRNVLTAKHAEIQENQINSAKIYKPQQNISYVRNCKSPQMKEVKNSCKSPQNLKTIEKLKEPKDSKINKKEINSIKGVNSPKNIRNAKSPNNFQSEVKSPKILDLSLEIKKNLKPIQKIGKSSYFPPKSQFTNKNENINKVFQNDENLNKTSQNFENLNNLAQNIEKLNKTFQNMKKSEIPLNFNNESNKEKNLNKTEMFISKTEKKQNKIEIIEDKRSLLIRSVSAEGNKFINNQKNDKIYHLLADSIDEKKLWREGYFRKDFSGDPFRVYNMLKTSNVMICKSLKSMKSCDVI